MKTFLPFSRAAFAVIWKWSRCREMQPQRRRHNGWTWPPSFLQLFFWVTVPVVASITAFLLMPLHKLYAPIVVFIGTVWLVLQIIVLTCIDPAASNLRKDQAPAYFDASKHEHVIENLFCNICLIHVDPTCKHCGQCNKCISGFDHHCNWLNNCIGAINYRLFLLLVLSVCFVSTLISSSLIVLAAISFINIRLLPDTGQRGMTTYHFIRINRRCKQENVPREKPAVFCALVSVMFVIAQLLLFVSDNSLPKCFQNNQKQQQQENLSMNVNALPDLASPAKNHSKLNIIKSRAVQDSNIDNPYVSFTFQDNNGLK